MDFTGYPHLEQVYAGLGRAVDSILAGRRNPPGQLADARHAVRRAIDFKALNDQPTVDGLNDTLGSARESLINSGHDVSAFDAATGQAFNPEPPPNANVDTTRPDGLPEQTTDDPSVVPNEGGPWTTAHAQALPALVMAVGGHTSLALASSATPIAAALGPYTGGLTVTGLTPQIVTAIADDRIPEQYTEQRGQYKPADDGREPVSPAVPDADEGQITGGAEEIGDDANLAAPGPTPQQTSTAPDWTGASIEDHQQSAAQANQDASYQQSLGQQSLAQNLSGNQSYGYWVSHQQAQANQAPSQRQGDGTEA